MKYTNNYQFVRGQAFFNDYPKWNAIVKARAYCKANGIDGSEIYTLSNESEQKFLEELLKRDDIYEIKSHEKVCLMAQFVNSNDDVIPSFMFQTSFTYRDKVSNKPHVVYVANNVYSLTKELVLSKTLYDREHFASGCYLEVYLYDIKTNTFNEWKIGSRETFKEVQKYEHQTIVAQKKAIRDRQKYDRLLQLRDEGKITERQSQMLYRLEKVFGGNK